MSTSWGTELHVPRTVRRDRIWKLKVSSRCCRTVGNSGRVANTEVNASATTFSGSSVWVPVAETAARGWVAVVGALVSVATEWLLGRL